VSVELTLPRRVASARLGKYHQRAQVLPLLGRDTGPELLHRYYYALKRNVEGRVYLRGHSLWHSLLNDFENENASGGAAVEAMLAN
jgi:hypothetical protein